jgi:hypothetical protein
MQPGGACVNSLLISNLRLAWDLHGNGVGKGWVMSNRHKLLFALAFAVSLARTLPGRAQEGTPPSSGGWRKFGQPQPPDPQPSSPQAAVPAASSRLVLPAGAWITVRINELLSSDHNQSGDAFTATLAEPLVADGLVAARRGQTVEGRVVEALKAGRVKGTSSLRLELTQIRLVDGQQLPVRTELIERRGDTSAGRDVGAVGAATGLGAAIGAAADGGFGAGMGAIAGAAVSTIGVLVTRGRPTVVYPETVLTFRLLDAVTINTARSEQAFQPVRPEDYEQKPLRRRGAGPRYGPPPPPYVAGCYYPYYCPPLFYAPGFFFFSSTGFYGRGWRRW